MSRRVGVIALGACLASCSGGADVAAASKAIDGFHAAINAGRFEAIYEASSGEMKAATPRDRTVALLAAVHRKLGTFRSGTVQGWRDNYSTSGHFVSVGYTAKFDRDTAAEQFTFRVDGAPTLAGYNINSSVMMLN